MELKTGIKAYFDTFAGLIPCRVQGVTGTPGPASTAQTVLVKLTTSRGAYKQGETVKTNGLHAVPRTAVHYRCGIARIRPYSVAIDA